MSAEQRFDRSLKLTFTSLNLSGIKVGSTSSFHFLYFITIVWIYTDVVGEICWIIDGFITGKSFTQLCLMAPCITICVYGSVKTAPLHFQRGFLANFVAKLRSLHPDTDDSKIESNVVKRIIKKCETVVMLFTSLCAVVAMMFNFLPLILMGYKYFTSHNAEITFPFSVKYVFEFDLKAAPVWPWVYFHQVVSTFMVIFQVVGADTLFYGSCEFIQMHFRILGSEIQHQINGDENEEIVNRKMREFIRRHQELIELVSQLEQLYSYSSLFNFVTSSFLICLSGFIVTTIPDTYLKLCFTAFLAMSLSQISIFCYGGDLIMRSSNDIGDAVYNSRWYASSAGYKRNVLILLARAQRPCKLTAANFADLNLAAFTTVIRRSWSYFALLKTMYQ